MRANNAETALRTRSHWLVGYGLARATLKLLARRGDPSARLMIDNNQPDNAHQPIERIRER
ncbi:hypothetical protein BST14_17480 [Mycobacterium arosiense ATCC BAA-1401 = DSM 45069]|uniref:Uncharacterized protein n=1 Tax=Mycobacterium arosiense ATCC BAA-1401 = DSM 45069 TaxID=1265311 RepID=A0A1W9ZDL1_MYCAI|nr:hypothetical protein BST14_17480 [Mycobacterium arosiense ATCC BAA-1401 = DSM 45069]